MRSFCGPEHLVRSPLMNELIHLSHERCASVDHRTDKICLEIVDLYGSTVTREKPADGTGAYHRLV